MKVIYTQQSLDSLEESMHFLMEELGIPEKRVSEIITRLLNRADHLAQNPREGQTEIYLDHLGKEYRRLIEGHFKIIYLIEGNTVYITDFFDARQDPKDERLIFPFLAKSGIPIRAHLLRVRKSETGL